MTHREADDARVMHEMLVKIWQKNRQLKWSVVMAAYDVKAARAAVAGRGALAVFIP